MNDAKNDKPGCTPMNATDLYLVHVLSDVHNADVSVYTPVEFVDGVDFPAGDAKRKRRFFSRANINLMGPVGPITHPVTFELMVENERDAVERWKEFADRACEEALAKFDEQRRRAMLMGGAAPQGIPPRRPN